MKLIQDIEKGKLHSAYAVGPFDKAKEALESKGYRIISLEEQVGLRVKHGLDSSISQRGNWVREGFIYIPSKGVFLTKESPIITNAEQATNCHRRSIEFYLNDKQVEKSLADSVEITDTKIPTNRFADEALTSFAFGKNAKEYGEFLKENGISDIQVYLATSQDKPFAKQAWLYGIDWCVRSDLGGDDGYLDCAGYEVRGVRASTKGASHSQKSRLEKSSYTQRQVEMISKILAGVREGTIPSSKLEKVLDFMEKLKR